MFYLIQNSNDKDVYDVATKARSGQWQVWGQVHSDFLAESGLYKNYTAIKEAPKIIPIEIAKEQSEE